jgi:hypothetical protein
MIQLQREEVLWVPKRRRLVHARLKGAEGQDVLHLFYGEKEIVFDDPELLPFGGKLLEADRFRAEEAMSWSGGAPYEWDKVRDLLEALIGEEILKRVSDSTARPETQAFPERLGLAPVDRQPRTFSAHDDQCPAITQEAFGRPFHLSNLEVVIPAFRVAHPTLDRDGRQVGENNASPAPLFLDLPTQRRLCSYAGSRYHADEPMNVTALKYMTSRWPELLSLTAEFRKAFFARLSPRDAQLRAGEIHLLSVCSLASVGYVMVRGIDPVPNGQLDAGLAGMFRLVDGVRIVATEMLRSTNGDNDCDRHVNAQMVADFADQNRMYTGAHGVCAGPQGLIDEYLRVLLGEAEAPIHVDPDLASRLGDLDAAIDYGLHGQRIESMLRVFGASQGLLVERLRKALAPRGAHGALRAVLDAPSEGEGVHLHPLVTRLELEMAMHRWLFDRAADGLERGAPGARETVDELLRLEPASLAVSERRLAEFMAGVLPDERTRSEALQIELPAVAAQIFALERRCLRALETELTRLNEGLKRPSGPQLTGADIAIYNRPRSGPSFASTLAEGLGLHITTSANSTVLSTGERSLSLAD